MMLPFSRWESMFGRRTSDTVGEKMMKMVVNPHQGVGPLRFGMTRAETERAVGMIPKRYVPNQYALEVDSFGELGLVVMYDQGGHSNAISFVRGFGVDLEYDSYRLFDHPAREVRA